MVGLDQKDLEILYYLKQNARISLTQLGKYLKLSPATITNRMKSLNERQVIKNYTININYHSLTPDYQAYIVHAKIKNSVSKKVYEAFENLGIFTKMYKLAGANNFLGTTIPIKKKDLESIGQIFEVFTVDTFTIVPIITSYEECQKDLLGENITNLYCPQCQETFKGRAIVTEVRENKLMGFCCEECKNDFLQKYNAILSK